MNSNPMPTGTHPRLVETATAENAVPVVQLMSDAALRRLPSFVEVTLKAVVVHTVTYFGVGLLAFTLLDYAALFAEPEMQSWLRQTNDPIVALGPALQPLRGLLFAIACYPCASRSLAGSTAGWRSGSCW